MSILDDVYTGFVHLVPLSKFEIWMDGYNDLKLYFDEFKYRLKKSLGKSEANPKILLAEIARACSEIQSNDLLLLLSSGKDSVSLLLGFAEVGKSIECLSIVSTDEEKSWINRIVKKLGHKVNFVHSAEISKYLISNDYLTDIQYGICYDQAMVLMEAALKITGFDCSPSTLVDGSGNDIYFGNMPNRKQYISGYFGDYLYSIPLHSYLRYYFRLPYEAHGLATASSFLLRLPQVSYYVENLKKIPYGRGIEDVVDYRGFVRGGLVSDFCYSEKTRIIAKKNNVEVVFPWESESLKEYVFNLPLEYKVQFSDLTNKVLLRSMLQMYLSYDRPKRGLDALNSISLVQVTEFAFVRQLPTALIKRLINNRFFPENAVKRALIECGLCFHYAMNAGLEAREFEDFIFSYSLS